MDTLFSDLYNFPGKAVEIMDFMRAAARGKMLSLVSINLIDVEYSPSLKKGSRGEAPGGLGKAQSKAKFSPAFFKRRWGPGAKPRVGLGKAQQVAKMDKFNCGVTPI